jgi:hypothetical protein
LSWLIFVLSYMKQKALIDRWINVGG